MRPATVYVLFNLLLGLSMGFTATSYVPFVLSIGVTMPQVALINAAFFLTIVLMELPTGMLADGRSRAWSVRAGALLSGLGHLAYAFASGLTEAIVCEVIIGVAFAFMSGTLEAWAADAVGGDGERLRRTFGSGALFTSLGLLVGGCVSAPLCTLDLRLGMIIGGGFGLAAFVVACAFMGEAGEPAVRTSEVTAFKDSWQALKNGPALRWALVAFAAFALVLSFNHYWAPFFRVRVEQAGLAYVWLVIYGGCLVGAFALRRWADSCRGHETTAVVLTIALTAVGMTLIGLAGGLVVPLALAFLHEIGRGAFKPLMEAFVQCRITSSFRATYGSLQSLIGRAGYALVLALVWLLTRHLPDGDALIVLTWVVQGSLLLLIAGALWLFRPRKID
ncbi:MAG: MFS transporter [Patescibacteria group bacterium]